MANSDRPIVLLTGGTGYVGFRILTDLLATKKYLVRVVVRSPAKAEGLRGKPIMRVLRLGAEDIEFVTIPDLAAAGAFKDAMGGVKYVIHCATPTKAPTDDPSPDEMREHFVTPAVRATLEILESAAAPHSCVERVVITSSIYALGYWELFISTATESPKGQQGEAAPTIISESSREPEYHHKDEILRRDGALAGYGMSKVASLAATERFMRGKSEGVRGSSSKKMPSFSVVQIHPSYVVGRNELGTQPDEIFSFSNPVVLMPVLGRAGQHTKYAGMAVHIADVSRMHILALDDKNLALAKEGGEHVSLLASTNVQWEDVNAHCAGLFPDAVAGASASGGGSGAPQLANSGKSVTIKSVMGDASHTSELLRESDGAQFVFLGLREMVHSIVQQYLELATP